MQKRIPTDTRKSHFPTRGRRETGFVSKEKKFVSNALRYIASSSQKNQVFTLHPCFCIKLIFSSILQKKRLKAHSGTIGQIPYRIPPPPSTSAQTTSRTLEYDNRLSKNWVAKKVAKRMWIESQEPYVVFLENNTSTKTRRKWWALACRSSKSQGFYAIFGRNVQNYDCYRRPSLEG